MTYRISSSERPSEAVVAATAGATGSSAIGSADSDAGSSAAVLDPLYEAIDPEALDGLFRPTASGDRRSNGHVSFVYSGYEVEVHGRGLVTVQRTETTRDGVGDR